MEYLDRVGGSRPAELASMQRHVDLLREQGQRLPMPLARMIDARLRLFELRPGIHRVAYARHAGAFVLLHAWRKSTQKLDRRELRVARSRLEDWRSRTEGRP